MKKVVAILLLLATLVTLSGCDSRNKCRACNGSGYYKKKECFVCNGTGYSDYFR